MIESFGYDPSIDAGYAIETPVDTIAFVGTPDIPNLDWVRRRYPGVFPFLGQRVALDGHDENFFEWSSGELFLFNVGLAWRPTDQIRLEATYQHQQVNRRTDGSLWTSRGICGRSWSTRSASPQSG